MELVMESVKEKCKSVWGRCKRCRGGSRRRRSSNIVSMVRESLGKKQNKKKQMAPEGCFWVYVGPQRERFLVKIELANHPVFKELLDDAESEYGFRNDGPIRLPCDVNLFCDAVAEMEIEMEEDKMSSASWACSFHPKSYPNSLMHSPLSNLSNHTGTADYELLSPCRLYV
ncbi:protein SMALL AUXIN UP-REGULATED RNA 10-like [Neltuma alba]|uniref:protein SMALL AUXIN UP-REGULATED RNA 10-like n=1 Tax=Neltuma alba TaxID=207710 RepID=UPI0010A2BFD5|nr:protein SMALL AUXIN UP-REGULATED RNA 10-like [Prosopis alba]XP_028782667.1 protein SMALL AUXIN UP-REGULATED RNA 10-like [Prosopis alba]